MVAQVLRREKLNKSELLTNFLRLIQAWAVPLGHIMVAQREAWQLLLQPATLPLCSVWGPAGPCKQLRGGAPCSESGCM